MNKISKSEITRKVIHLLSAIIPLSYLWIIKDRWIMLSILVILTLFALIVEYLRKNGGHFSKWFHGIFHFMLRDNESKGEHTGATWLLIGWTITVMLFKMPIAVAALLFLSIGDSFAAIVGKLYPIIKIGDKTLSGTFSGFIASFLIVMLINQSLIPIVILSGSVVAMVVELIPSKLNDNLTMPIFSGLIMMYLETAV
ncbi:MAG: SEC59/DGK1/VTE5 family protein [Candidatus Neomarinimicrobiota bacterium]